eukprot:s2347_g4.t1
MFTVVEWNGGTPAATRDLMVTETNLETGRPREHQVEFFFFKLVGDWPMAQRMGNYWRQHYGLDTYPVDTPTPAPPPSTPTMPTDALDTPTAVAVQLIREMRNLPLAASIDEYNNQLLTLVGTSGISPRLTSVQLETLAVHQLAEVTSILEQQAPVGWGLRVPSELDSDISKKTTRQTKNSWFVDELTYTSVSGTTWDVWRLQRTSDPDCGIDELSRSPIVQHPLPIPYSRMLGVEVLFPTSANWYSSHVADALPDGTVVVATNQALTVLAATVRQATSILPLRSRVTGVAIGEDILGACCADRVVHAFRLKSLETCGTHKEHHAEPSAMVNVKGLIITGDKRGALCLWTPGAATKSVERMVPQKEAVISLAASACSTRLAVGYHSGTVALVSLESHRFYCFRLRAAVQALSWLPSSNGLVTACQDQSVQLWRLQSEAAEEEAIAECQIAPAAGQSRDESKSWTSVCALSDALVLFSGSRGELFCWEESRQKPSRAAPSHTRPIFGMKAVGSDHVLTTGMDRFIVLWSVASGSPPQMKWRFCSLGGHVTALRVDANIACIGCGDNSLRVIDLMHREHRQHCWVAWKGLRTAVTSLAPATGTGVWGYGLQDGSFGVLAVNSSEGPGPAEPLCSRSHPAPVTSVCWLHFADPVEAVTADSAPKADDDQTEGRGSKKGKTKKEDKKGSSDDCRNLIQGLALISLSAGHKVFVTPVKGTTTTLQLQPLAGVAASPCAAVVWPLGKPSKGEEILVVAAIHKASEATVESNSFQLFQLDEGREELRCVGVVPADGLDGGAQSMSLCETSGEKMSCRLLCGTSKGGVSVFQLQWPLSAAVAQAVQADSPPPPLLAEAMVRQCHSKAVVDVQWRPSGSDRESSQLLSAGQDGLIKVWCFEKSPATLKLQSVANPVQNTANALLAACWDMSGEEPAVLAGGRDQIAFRWLPSEEVAPALATPLPVAPVKEVATRPPAASRPKAAAKAGGGTSLKQEKSSLLALTSAALYQQSSKARALELARVSLGGDAELWPGESLRADSPGSITESIFTNCQPFADRWLEMEVQHKQQAEDPHRARLLQLWAPELFDDVPPPEMPLVSAQWLWAALSNDPKTTLAEMVVAKSESIHHRAAAALVLGRLEDAVGLYLTNELLAEALLLARLRLPSRHPLVLHIYRSWAQDFRRRGRQDQAALCFFATKEFGNALSNLEDWLALPRALLGPDPLRLSGAFAAAKAAAQLAGAKADGIQDGAGSQEDGSEDDCDATLAFDHRSWWGRPELRAAVQAWKRCMVEALYTGDSSSALKVARVGPLKRDLSHGERFLRGAFAGYASAMAWWMQLRKEGEWPKEECPLAAFVETGSSCLDDDDIDWDFEWRALTWLPAYSSEEDCLLTAAVELGRSCASLSSGGRNAEAPWTHLLKAINALVKGATTALQTLPGNETASPAMAEGLLQVVTPLERLVALLSSLFLKFNRFAKCRSDGLSFEFGPAACLVLSR